MPRKKQPGEGSQKTGTTTSLVASPAIGGIPKFPGSLPMLPPHVLSNAALPPAPSLFTLVPPPPSTTPLLAQTRALQNNPDFAQLQERRRVTTDALLALREKTGSRPLPPSNAPSAERRKRSRSIWNSVLEEMKWMATDFSQERAFKDAQRKQIASSLLEQRMRTKKNKTAVAVEKFWASCGGQVDGRPLSPDPVASPLERKSGVVLGRDGDFSNATSKLLFPSLAGIDVQSMSTKQRLATVRRLASPASSSPLVSHSPYFTGELSPVQYHTLRRAAQLTRFGLGAIACDSHKSDHRTTIAALIAFLGSELQVHGPHLVCCSDAFEMVQFQAIVALKCPDYRVVSFVDNLVEDRTALKTQFGPRDVVFSLVSSSTPAGALEIDWGLVVFSLGEINQQATPANASASSSNISQVVPSLDGTSTAAEPTGSISVPAIVAQTTVAFPTFEQPIRWGKPIFLLGHDLSALFSKNNLNDAITKMLDVEDFQIPDIVASPISVGAAGASNREDADFPLMESLVPCTETQEQRFRRRMAKGDQALQELAAIHSDVNAAAAFALAWNTDPVPPPRRTYSSSTWSTDDITIRHSGKFVEALNLIRSHRCRRSIVVSTRKSVLEAFSAAVSFNLTCFRMDCGGLHARIASWLRFLDSDFACVLARPTDLERYCTSKRTNASVDSVILLDCFTSEQDVGRIRSVVKHASVYRLFTRGTIEQSALESAQHPCLASAMNATSTATAGNGSSSSSSSASSSCELRAIPRTFELPNDTAPESGEVLDVENGLEKLYNDPQFRSLSHYARDFATGKSGSKSYHGNVSAPTLTSAPASSSSSSLPVRVSLFYDATPKTATASVTAQGSIVKITPATQQHQASSSYLFQHMQDESDALVEFADEESSDMPLLNRPRYVVAFAEKPRDQVLKGGSTTPPFQPKKKQKTSTTLPGEEMNGLALPASSVLGGSSSSLQGVSNTTGMALSTVPITPVGASKQPFTEIEDNVLRHVLDNYGFSPNLATEILNSGRFSRNGANGVSPAPVRTVRDVLERLHTLPKRPIASSTSAGSEFEALRDLLKSETSTSSSPRINSNDEDNGLGPAQSLAESTSRKAISSQFRYWRDKSNQKTPANASPRKSSQQSPKLEGATNLLADVKATSERRLGPMHFLIPPVVVPPAPPPIVLAPLGPPPVPLPGSPRPIPIPSTSVAVDTKDGKQ